MNISYTARGFAITGQIKKFTEEKLRKILALDEVLEVTVNLEHARHRYKAELLAHNRSARLTAIEETADIFKSINGAVDKIQKQLKRHKEKLVNRKRQAVQRAVKMSDNMVSSEKTPRVMRTRKQDIKPMSQEEALLQIEARKETFLLFRNIDSDRINVLYRRKDGNYGLIEPEI